MSTNQATQPFILLCLQFDVCYLSYGWHHLVNAYQGKGLKRDVKLQLTNQGKASMV